MRNFEYSLYGRKTPQKLEVLLQDYISDRMGLSSRLPHGYQLVCVSVGQQEFLVSFRGPDNQLETIGRRLNPLRTEFQDSPKDMQLGNVGRDSSPIYTPPGINTWENFTLEKRIRITPVANLPEEAHQQYLNLVEGTYRDNPNDSSHGPEHAIERRGL